jgi:hypothetical protein
MWPCMYALVERERECSNTREVDFGYSNLAKILLYLHGGSRRLSSESAAALPIWLLYLTTLKDDSVRFNRFQDII